MKHLLSIADLDAAEIRELLSLAAQTHSSTCLQGKTIANLFFENSTRTRLSFEMAAKQGGAQVVNFTAGGSSVAKGETLLDTVKTVDAMGVDAIVLRHGDAGAAEFVSEHVTCSVINAGDGAHAHPTQALLDAWTVLEHRDSLDGLILVIVGDIEHSRVARSNIWLFTKLGAHVRLCGPRTMVTDEFANSVGVEGMVTVHHNLAESLTGADVVMALRIQKERMKGEASRIPSDSEYAATFGLNEETIGFAKEGALVLHPGPMNRGVEISTEVADGPQSCVFQQVKSGVAVRKAVLRWALGG